MMLHKISSTTGIIILAAGESSRLGSPKQLLDFKGKYLLQHIIDVAKDSLAAYMVLVLGAYAEEIEARLELNKVDVIHNGAWKEGLSSSIRCGLEAMVQTHPETETVLFLLCDQPFLTTSVINQIIAKYIESGKGIIASDYGQASGPPALFHKSMFAFLMQLNGNQGAKSIMLQFPEELAYADFPEGKIDIDTVSDYEIVKRNNF
ncbi:MAG: nucleotidyltransferase family protein [Saprospiraceae bacterium]|nr:nucleotidyltransferase family protein [Saprospiraceae bacterium]